MIIAPPATYAPARSLGERHAAESEPARANDERIECRGLARRHRLERAFQTALQVLQVAPEAHPLIARLSKELSKNEKTAI